MKPGGFFYGLLFGLLIMFLLFVPQFLQANAKICIFLFEVDLVFLQLFFLCSDLPHLLAGLFFLFLQTLQLLLEFQLQFVWKIEGNFRFLEFSSLWGCNQLCSSIRVFCAGYFAWLTDGDS